MVSKNACHFKIDFIFLNSFYKRKAFVFYCGNITINFLTWYILYFRCRKTQAVFDKCMKDKLGSERPPADLFARVHVHKTARPRPEVEGPTVYEDATPGLPPDAAKPPAKYGSRYIFMW